MSEHSIFGEAGGAGRRDHPSPGAESRRPNPGHGLFGIRLLPNDRKASGSDEDELPRSRN